MPSSERTQTRDASGYPSPSSTRYSDLTECSDSNETRIKNPDYENSDVLIRFLDYLSRESPPPPSKPSAFMDPTAPQLVNRYVELIVTYHSAEPFCMKCTKSQSKKIGGLLALNLRPMDKLQHLGTYSKVPEGPLLSLGGLAGKMDKVAAKRGWRATATVAHPSWDVADEALAPVPSDAERMDIYRIVQKHWWDSAITIGGYSEAEPPKETYHLHFGQTQSSLRAYTRSGQRNPTHRLLRSKGISPTERDVFMLKRKAPTDQKDIIDMHICMAQPTEYYSTDNRCPGKDTHHQHASRLVRQMRGMSQTLHRAMGKACFQATCMSLGLSEEDLPHLE